MGGVLVDNFEKFGLRKLKGNELNQMIYKYFGTVDDKDLDNLIFTNGPIIIDIPNACHHEGTILILFKHYLLSPDSFLIINLIFSIKICVQQVNMIRKYCLQSENKKPKSFKNGSNHIMKI